jgi:hypothetical protein
MRKQELASAVATLKAKARGGEPRLGNVGLTDKTLYLNVSAAGMGGTVQLVDVETKRAVGITNLDGNKLNSGRDYVIDGIRVLYGKNVANTAVSNEKWLDPNTVELPAVLQNAEVRIEQDGKMLVDMPLRDLYENPDSAFRSLSTSPLIRSNKEYKFEIQFPASVSVPSDLPYNIRFEFRAHQGKTI